MKRILFISNIANKITNYTIPSITVSQDLGYEFHLAANCSGFTDDASKYNVTMHHIDLVRNPLSLKNIKAYRQMLDLIKEKKFDVIHCNNPIGGVLGRLCGKKAKVPKIIYTAHGFHFYKGAPFINRTLFKWAEMWMAHYTDAIITINQEDYQAALKFKLRRSGNVYYIPGVGVDTLTIKQADSKREEILREIGADNDSILIVSVGELNKNKNYEVIIKALGKLRDSNLHYLLCGIGVKRDELISIAKKNNIKNNIHFMGYRTDVPQLLKSCDIFVMPSLREGLSRAMMEAMSVGLPCICSKIRGNVDLIEEGKGGYLVKPNDVDEFAGIIYKVVENVELRQKMRKYNLEAVKKYDIKNIQNIVRNVYKEEVLGDDY